MKKQISKEPKQLQYTDDNPFILGESIFPGTIDMNKATDSFGEVKVHLNKVNFSNYNVIATLTG